MKPHIEMKTDLALFKKKQKHHPPPPENPALIKSI